MTGKTNDNDDWIRLEDIIKKLAELEARIDKLESTSEFDTTALKALASDVDDIQKDDEK